MDAAEFFSRFAALVGDNPPHANDYPILARMKRIGLEPSKAFDFANMPPQTQSALNKAIPICQKRLTGGLAEAGTVVNNWGMLLSPIGTYGTDYYRRALDRLRRIGGECGRRCHLSDGIRRCQRQTV